MTWTHSICERCWIEREYNSETNTVRRPVTLVQTEEVESCCFCGEMTIVGIFVREDPQKLTCTH